jgi:hypothetical protein
VILIFQMVEIRDTKVYSLSIEEDNRFFHLAHDCGFMIDTPSSSIQVSRDIYLFRQQSEGGCIRQGIYSFDEDARIKTVIPLPGSDLEKIMEKHFPKK